MSPEEKAALATRLRGGRPEREIRLDPATRVIAVASGKGGVGKSTLTANLAAALVERGERVGVLDADVYGYSIPHVLGVTQRPIVVDSLIVPPVRGELKVMSIGLFAEDNGPIMWRGPMLHKALEQFLSDVHWGELDTLVVDMPPGTGDVAISIGQLLPRAEAIVVTTPQPAAQQVAVRAAVMAQKTGMRVVGVVENMAWLVGTGQELFGAGGGDALAAEIDAPVIARIPFDPALREASDAGMPGARSGARVRGRRGDPRPGRDGAGEAGRQHPQGPHGLSGLPCTKDCGRRPASPAGRPRRRAVRAGGARGRGPVGEPCGPPRCDGRPSGGGLLPSCTPAPGGGAAIQSILTGSCEDQVRLPSVSAKRNPPFRTREKRT